MALWKLCPYADQCIPVMRSRPLWSPGTQAFCCTHLGMPLRICGRQCSVVADLILHVPALFETPLLSGAWTCAEPNGRLWAGNAQHAKAGLRADDKSGLKDLFHLVTVPFASCVGGCFQAVTRQDRNLHLLRDSQHKSLETFPRSECHFVL